MQTKQSFIFLKKTVCFSLFFIASFFLVCFAFLPLDQNAPASNSASANSSQKETPTVILDAGHGGVDSGASANGAEEKHINLSVVKKIGAFLEAGGVQVIYTRTEDEMLTSDRANTRKTGDLLGRAEVAKNHPDAIFLSIHMNTLPSEKYSGLQVFYSEQNSLNKALARQIQSDVCALLQKTNTRKEKDAGGKIFLLDRLECPAVLIECGFLTNRAECEKLQSNEYQNALAFAISRSVLRFFEDQKMMIQ